MKADVSGTCDGWIKFQLETRQFQLSDMFLQLSISGEDLSVEVERTIVDYSVFHIFAGNYSNHKNLFCPVKGLFTAKNAFFCGLSTKIILSDSLTTIP